MTSTTMTDPRTDAAAVTAALHPKAPRTRAETGLGEDLLTQLILKQLFRLGDMLVTDLARSLGVQFPVIEDVLTSLRMMHQCEIVASAAVGAPSYRYRISDEGRRRAQLFFEQNNYSGVAPVPLAQYQSYLRAYRTAAPTISTRDRIAKAFSHLVLSQRVLDQVGTAAAAGHSLFVYGPPGNGKTVIAQGLGRLLDGEIAIPHAVEIDGHIVRMFDPVNHEPLPPSAPSDDLLTPPQLDDRWVRCKRPMVTVGGELTLNSLDLSYSREAGVYTPPVQAIANGGVLVIDDFGRQHCSPRDLLNRWIVPLESRVDFLTLNNGQKFELPFLVLVVFATNLKPADLVDEAFLRRVQFKVLAESPTYEDFEHIWENCCRDRKLAHDPAMPRYVFDRYLGPNHIQARGCHPRDLIDQALAYAAYTSQPRALTTELLDAACASYFVDEAQGISRPA
jgi:predicted ATPase with chaperone activity